MTTWYGEVAGGSRPQHIHCFDKDTLTDHDADQWTQQDSPGGLKAQKEESFHKKTL